MKIEVVSLFPKMFDSPQAEGMVKRAIDKKIIELKIHQMRQWAWNSYGAVDDRPYGGGVGMLIRADVIAGALKSIGKGHKILLSARGKRLTQEKVEELAKKERLILICGRYEGVDQRVADFMVDEEISIGDYVLSGGELAAMILIDAVARLQPGVLGKDESNKDESFSGPKRNIEYPQYTRPFEWEGHKVPEELLSGDPIRVKCWKSEQGQKEQKPNTQQ